MRHIILLTLFTLTACGKEESPLPFGGTTDGSDSPPDDTSSPAADPTTCGDEDWEESNGAHIQPITCLVWSPRSEDSMDWYSATSTEDAQAGSCGSDCPEEGNPGHCPTFDGLDGRTDWRMPTRDELKEAAKEYPEFENVDARLWSRDTGSGSTGNAWTVNLSGAGAWMEMDKEDDGNHVRCVSDS